MAQIRLNRPGVLPIQRQIVAAGVAKHMRMHGEVEFCSLAGFRDNLSDSARAKGATAFADKYKRAVVLILALESMERSGLSSANWVGTGDSFFEAIDVG